MTLANETQSRRTGSPGGERRGYGALILLGGAVRPTALTQGIGRSLLDLPVEKGKSVLELWAEEAAALAEGLGMEELLVRVLVDRESALPAWPRGKEVISDRVISDRVEDGTVNGERLTVNSELVGGKMGRVRFRIERDPGEFRGTGGVLRDVAREYDQQERILVGNGASVLLRPLMEHVNAMQAAEGDVTFVCYHDGSPSSLMAIRCGCLRGLPEIGFVDLKEQGLAQIAREHRVRVVARKELVSQSVRTLGGYIGALHRLHRAKSEGAEEGAFAEDWRPTFAIVEAGAEVEKTARVHDSVVLAGARVERGAVVVRSVVGPRGVVRRGEEVVDQVRG